MSAPDERTAEEFRFPVDDPDSGWYWQRAILDWWLNTQRSIALKARQLGITWLACAYVLWVALYKPGSLCLVYRQKEEEAHENIGRCWSLLLSLPKHLWNGAEVLTPAKGAFAKGEIALRFPDGSRSRIVAMTSASASGHGKTAAVVLLDEFSRIERASEIMKAVQPAAGAKGKIIVISTANGRSNPDTGEGNQFHWLWEHADESGFSKRFLAWSLHPDRDQRWYDHDPEVRGLKSHERAEQYPANEHEAFTLTNRVFFDPEDLEHYRALVRKPARHIEFAMGAAGRDAKIKQDKRSPIAIFSEPKPNVKYAIGADVATGRGVDYSAAYVVDLSTMELAAEFHARIDADLFATQLHFLGRFYNSATIAVETAGGFGEAVIIPLRDGREGRPAYPKLYRHVLSSRPDMPISKPFGFPTNSKTRPLILNQFEKAVRERVLPYVSDKLLWEMESFVHQDNGTSPRAQEGSHDDLLMACAIALEMYRLQGSHPNRKRKKPRREPVSYPWQTRAA
jgi:hypothetical protein